MQVPLGDDVATLKKKMEAVLRYPINKLANYGVYNNRNIERVSLIHYSYRATYNSF